MENEAKNVILAAKQALSAKKDTTLSMLIGLDGFVDEIIHVVKKRIDFDTYERLELISDLGEQIIRAAGFSANIEFVPKQVKLGGNGPIFANALINCGVNMTYIGALGKENIHPVFSSVSERAKVYSLCDPGHTDALEFNDGKLMLGKIEVLNELTWELVKSAFGGAKSLAEVINTQDVFGMENWTMIPHMSDIWQGMVDEVFPLLDSERRPIAFFDLADPEKRTKEDILRALELIGKFEQKFRAVLGLNEKEAYEIAEVYGVNEGELSQIVQKVYEKLGISCLVVHPTKEAMCCVKEGFFRVDGPFCAKPVLTTGAGDNFNAGFCLGLALGLEPLNSLILGVGTSGYYVRKAKSPSLEDELEFLESWANGFEN